VSSPTKLRGREGRFNAVDTAQTCNTSVFGFSSLSFYMGDFSVDGVREIIRAVACCDEPNTWIQKKVT